MPLPPRQQRFVQEYAIDFNGLAAAKRAGYASIGAGVQAARLLKNARVQAAIEAEKAKHGAQIAITKEWLTKNLAEGFIAAKEAKNHAGMGRLGELLARMHAYIPEPERRVRIIRELGDLSDDELTVLAAVEQATIEGESQG